MSANLPSTQPYLIRAIHEWCTDNGFTPHVVVQVDDRVRVPGEYVRDGRIVLNVAYEATGGLQIGNDLVSFQARFGGVARDISFPVGNVAAIYAHENGAGMAFEPESAAGPPPASRDVPGPEPRTPPPAGRPNLKRVK
jgi:stringent starvation protein B